MRKIYNINKKILLLNKKIDRADELINTLDSWIKTSIMVSTIQIISLMGGMMFLANVMN